MGVIERERERKREREREINNWSNNSFYITHAVFNDETEKGYG